jgi:hypothetical protein
MTATLSIINNFSLDSQGVPKSGKQGTSTDAPTTAFEITVTGTAHHVTGTLATATIATVWDDDDDLPADWDYLFYWADQDTYIQVIGPSMSVVFKVLAKVPFTLTYDGLTAAASATAIAGNSEPTPSDIDSIVIGNYSGTAANYTFSVID